MYTIPTPEWTYCKNCKDLIYYIEINTIQPPIIWGNCPRCNTDSLEYENEVTNTEKTE